MTSNGSRSDVGLDAVEWLSAPLTESERAAPVEAPIDGEPEIAPLLAALIPALVSAAPAIISAVSAAFQNKPAPAPAPRPAIAPPPASVPRLVAQPRPPAPTAVPSPQPATASPPAANPVAGGDLTSQITALLPGLVTLVAGMLTQNQGQSPASESRIEALEPRCAECGPYQAWPEADHASVAAGGASQYSQLVPVPDRAGINIGVSPCPTSLLVARFGAPRSELTDECQATTSLFWRDRMVTESVGPFRVRGHHKAVAVFRDAFAALRAQAPELYARVGSMGMLCVRHVRGRPGVLSNHGLGMALDVTIDGQLDVRGDDLVQRGLLTIHDVFTTFGIYWGAGFRTEDAMHFEIGADVVKQWIQDGSI